MATEYQIAKTNRDNYWAIHTAISDAIHDASTQDNYKLVRALIKAETALRDFDQVTFSAILSQTNSDKVGA
jgi:hypothetical protein